MHSTKEYDERQLLEDIANGDETAFKHLYHHYRPRVYTLSIRLTGSAATSEEIVQDVFLKCWLKRSALTSIHNFPGYLVTITQNTVYTALRNLSRRRQRTAEYHNNIPDDLFQRDTEERLDQKEIDTIIDQAIDRLSPQQRQVYHLIKKNGLTREQAALEMQVSTETVKSHLAQAIRHIRAYCMLRLDLPVVLFLYWLAG